MKYEECMKYEAHLTTVPKGGRGGVQSHHLEEHVVSNGGNSPWKSSSTVGEHFATFAAFYTQPLSTPC